MTVVTIDLDVLAGSLSATLVDPEKLRSFANFIMAGGQFLSREVPAHVFTAHFVAFLKAIESVQTRGVTPTDRVSGEQHGKRGTGGQDVATSEADSGS